MALFKAKTVSVERSKSPVIAVICCVLATTSSSLVGSPSIPSDSLSIDFLESVALNPSAFITLGNLAIVSTRLIALSNEFLSTLNAALASLTAPIALTMLPIPELAFLVLPSNASKSPFKTFTPFPLTSTSIGIFPSAIIPPRFHLVMRKLF